MAHHILLDLKGVEKKKIEKVHYVKISLLNALEQSGLHMIEQKFHQFEPQGVTGFILLKESHVAIHTWPETRKLTCDIFTCGDEKCARTYAELIIRAFSPDEIVEHKITRH